MRVIDADALDAKLEALAKRYADQKRFEVAKDYSFVQTVLLTAPTIDAVPVVRCRECEHWKPTGSKAGNSFSDMEYIGGCEFTKYYRRESDFCSYGERKGDADNEP